MKSFSTIYVIVLLVSGLAFLFTALYALYADRYIQALASLAIGLILVSSSISLFRELKEQKP
uniref:Uncharacterized protein n=1 Tax=Ignisphaera aggregans TaxID=334771 RepID=A0A7J2U4A3_9CREN